MTRWVLATWIALGLCSLAIDGGMPGPEASSAPGTVEYQVPAARLARAGTALAAATVTPQRGDRRVTFTVVYDNNPYAPGLRAAWGFACWVQTPGGALLFDTGGDGPTLLGNLAKA
jgi:hypothetical protein